VLNPAEDAPASAQVPVGEGGTTAWKTCVLTPHSTVTLYLDVSAPHAVGSQWPEFWPVTHMLWKLRTDAAPCWWAGCRMPMCWVEPACNVQLLLLHLQWHQLAVLW
jgi:hypothetical protein